METRPDAPLTRDPNILDSGYTKREVLARSAMVGILAAPGGYLRGSDTYPQDVASQAVEQADALIAALNKKPKTPGLKSVKSS